MNDRTRQHGTPAMAGLRDRPQHASAGQRDDEPAEGDHRETDRTADRVGIDRQDADDQERGCEADHQRHEPPYGATAEIADVLVHRELTRLAGPGCAVAHAAAVSAPRTCASETTRPERARRSASSVTAMQDSARSRNGTRSAVNRDMLNLLKKESVPGEPSRRSGRGLRSQPQRRGRERGQHSPWGKRARHDRLDRCAVRHPQAARASLGPRSDRVASTPGIASACMPRCGSSACSSPSPLSRVARRRRVHGGLDDRRVDRFYRGHGLGLGLGLLATAKREHEQDRGDAYHVASISRRSGCGACRWQSVSTGRRPQPGTFTARLSAGLAPVGSCV